MTGKIYRARKPTASGQVQGPQPTEVKDPEKGAAMLDAATEPLLSKISEMAQQAGVPAQLMQAFLTRVRGRYQPFTGQIRKVRSDRILALVEDRVERALEFLDEQSLATASPRDLAVIIGILLEKRQLLRGEPTHILSTPERVHLEKMLPDLMAEAKRRGMVIDLDASGYATVVPEPGQDVEHRARKQLERTTGVGDG